MGVEIVFCGGPAKATCPKYPDKHADKASQTQNRAGGDIAAEKQQQRQRRTDKSLDLTSPSRHMLVLEGPPRQGSPDLPKW